jgi:ABC-type Zn uptake system ZnuABC Zn-binding protein ZnuA
MRKLLVVAIGVVLAAVPLGAKVQVVTTLPAYASIAKAVGGERVEAVAISRGDEDAHFVKPKPSFALMLKQADLFVTTGLDLELWAPTVVDKSGNKKIRDGQPGFVSASHGVPMLDVPESVSREGGDVHIYGNPHIHTSPLNAKIIAANIVAGLKRVDPEGAAAYDVNLVVFNRRLDEKLYGKELVELLGADVLDSLARQGKLIDFLSAQEYEGASLIERLGGWMGKGLVFRGQQLVAYHKNWIYFTDLFGLEVAGYVERKPGIPPSARHVHHLLNLIKDSEIQVLWASSYFSQEKVQSIAERAGCQAIIVSLGPMTVTADSYFELIDTWIDDLAGAFAG